MYQLKERYQLKKVWAHPYPQETTPESWLPHMKGPAKVVFISYCALYFQWKLKLKYEVKLKLKSKNLWKLELKSKL